MSSTPKTNGVAFVAGKGQNKGQKKPKQYKTNKVYKS